MERERFCWHSHLKRMRYVPNVPLRISYHELRVHSREPLHEGIYKHYRSSCPRLMSGAGGLVFAPVTQSLLDRYGAPVTLRILGVWNFVICVSLSFVIRPHPAYKPIKPSLALAKKGTFILQVCTFCAYILNPRPITQDLSSYWRRSFRPLETLYLYII